MATVVLPVVSGGGGWTAVAQTYPLNQNDGDSNTYQAWPGDTAGSNANFFDYTLIPDDATITDVAVSGLWGAGSAAATASFRYHDGTNNATLGTTGDVSSYSYNSATAPDGGAWTKAKVQILRLLTVSLQTGNGNTMKLRSCAATITYTEGVPPDPPDVSTGSGGSGFLV